MSFKKILVFILVSSLSVLLVASKKEKTLQFVEDGDVISKRYDKYVNKLTVDLNEDLSLFLNYSSEYRPLGIDLQPGYLKGIPGIEKYRAYQATAFFADNVKSNVAAYGQLMFLSYKVKETKNYGVFVFQDNILKLVKEISAEEIQDNLIPLSFAVDLVKDGGPGKTIKKPVFLIVPGEEIEKINQLFIPKELKYFYVRVNGKPYDMNHDDSISPSSHENTYGSAPQIVLYANQDGGIAAGWADENKVHITELNDKYKMIKDHTVKKEFETFGGFTKDDQGNVYILFTKKNADGNFDSNIRLVKYNSSLEKEGEFNLPIDREDGYDVMIPIKSASSRLVYGKGRVAVHMGKTQHKNKNDGLNHQCAILFVVKTDSMELDESLSMKWTASHSFDQKMIFDGQDFVNLDLADNFPRGFNLTKNKIARLIFTYKTHHGDQPAIRGSKTLPAGQWSNDNRTYSELGGLAYDPAGYIVLGSSEKSIDNDLAKENLNESRNIFMLLVQKDFNKTPLLKYNGREEYNMVNKKAVISSGEDSGTVSFFDFQGGIHYQKRVGVVWLTDFNNKNKENAIRPKLARISDNKYVALWEKWSSGSFITTQYLVFDAKGNVLKEITDLGGVRLNRGDDVIVKDGKVIWINGSQNKKSLKINVLEIE